MTVNLTTGRRTIIIAIIAVILILTGLAIDALGADIVGPESVPAGSGLVRLGTDAPEGSQLLWVPISPRTLDFVQVGEDIAFAAGCTETTYELQLIEVTADGQIVVDFHSVVIGDGPDPPIPPPAKKLIVFVVEETKDRTPAFAEELVKLRLWADNSPHTLLIIDDDTSSPRLAAYVTGDARPLLVVDTDLDASSVLHSGSCPSTAEDIKQLVSKYTSIGSLDKPPQKDARSGIRESMDTEQRIRPEFEVVRVGGVRFAKHRDTGHMYRVNESTGSFCVDGRCYRVEVR